MFGTQTQAGHRRRSNYRRGAKACLHAATWTTVEALDRLRPFEKGTGKAEERVYQLVSKEWRERLPVKVAGSFIKGGGASGSFDMYTQTSIGFTIAFSMFTIIFAVGEILEEKRTGVWDRINISPVARSRVLTGGLICAFIMGMINMTIMMLRTWAGGELLGHVGGVLVDTNCLCFCMTSLGLLLSFGIKPASSFR